MPIYEFRCLYCEKVFEDLCWSIRDWSECPACHRAAMRIMSASNFVIPGGSPQAKEPSPPAVKEKGKEQWVGKIMTEPDKEEKEKFE